MVMQYFILFQEIKYKKDYFHTHGFQVDPEFSLWKTIINDAKNTDL